MRPGLEQTGPKLGIGENFTLSQIWSFITILDHASKTLTRFVLVIYTYCRSLYF